LEHKEFVIETLNKIRSAAERCASGASDPIDDCLAIYAMARRIGESGRPILALFRGIESQLDELPRGEALKLASPSFAAATKQKKDEYRALFGKEIRDKCAEVIGLCDRALATRD